MKIAVLLRCLWGQVRTHVSLQMSEGMSYGELRECLLKWDRPYQWWGHLVGNTDAAPMEIDRVKWKGGQKGDGKEEVKTFIKERKKGKSYGKKGEQKGKHGGKKTKLLYFEWSPPWHFKTARSNFMSAWSGQVRVDIQLIPEIPSVTLNFADWLEAIFWRSFWHIFWHSFWHIFWHFFWHIFWHSFWHILWHYF